MTMCSFMEIPNEKLVAGRGVIDEEKVEWERRSLNRRPDGITGGR
jgi:hypothetical protein